MDRRKIEFLESICIIYSHTTYILYSASWLTVEHLRERQKSSVSFGTAVEKI
jgi:hypothetical protein